MGSLVTDWVSPPPPAQDGGSDDTEMRYSSQYEERLDPFSSFSKRVCELTSGRGRAVVLFTWPKPPSCACPPGLSLHQESPRVASSMMSVNSDQYILGGAPSVM